ncbi:MAG TPA: hypothetical protein PK876_10950, partial [Elusimicrobiota bacterium]|nr:hypothetical protein [Elusimicrobiota bacterium]
FGNTTTTVTEQVYTIVAGQAKIKTVSTSSVSDSSDGSGTSTDKSITTYSYVGEGMTADQIKAAALNQRNIGHLLSANATPVHSTTTDAFGNVSTNTTE